MSICKYVMVNIIDLNEYTRCEFVESQETGVACEYVRLQDVRQSLLCGIVFARHMYVQHHIGLQLHLNRCCIRHTNPPTSLCSTDVQLLDGSRPLLSLSLPPLQVCESNGLVQPRCLRFCRVANCEIDLVTGMCKNSSEEETRGREKAVIIMFASSDVIRYLKRYLHIVPFSRLLDVAPQSIVQ